MPKDKPKRLLIVFPKRKPKPSPAPAPKQSGDQFMLKALEAQKAGRLSALEISIAEDRLARGIDVPASIVGRVYA